MARVVDDAAHAQRRQCFSEAAARLIESKGYEHMTVQDVLDDVQQSKGAFYHYFDSKQALVEGLVDYQGETLFRLVEQHVRAPDLSVLDTLRCLFGEGNRLKLERKGLWNTLLPMWLFDGNAVVRERLSCNVRERMTPLLGRIINEGVEEGVFTIVRLLMAPQSGALDRARVEQAVAAYHGTLERVLGVPSGSLKLFDRAQVMTWLDRSGRAHGGLSSPTAGAAGARPCMVERAPGRTRHGTQW